MNDLKPGIFHGYFFMLLVIEMKIIVKLDHPLLSKQTRGLMSNMMVRREKGKQGKVS